MNASDIVKILNEMAPMSYKESWDKTGLDFGSFKKEIKKIMVAFSLTEEVIEEAIEKDIDMIIMHHPFWFNKLTSLNYDTNRGKMMRDLIKADIFVYSCHTNLDAAEGGVSDVLADLMDLKDRKVFHVNKTHKLYKLAFFVPLKDADKVRSEVLKAGAGHIGEYSDCSFNAIGTGTFLPLEKTNPYIGEQGKLEKVEEVKVETIVKDDDLNKVISTLLKEHPYEEVAYDVYLLQNKGLEVGIGRVGFVEEMSLKDFAVKVKEKLDCKTVRIYGNIDMRIKKVALSGGEGNDFIETASNHGVDVFLTGDMKYHPVQEALERNIAIIDAGHYDTEKHIVDYIIEYLNKKTQNIEVLKTSRCDDSAPFITI